MPQHYQLLRPRLSHGPSITAQVDYAKYLLRILVLLKFFRVFIGFHTSAYSFFKKNGNRFLKEKLEHLDF